MSKEIKFARPPLHLHSEPVQEFDANGLPVGVPKWRSEGVIVPFPPREKRTELSPTPNADDADEIEYEDTDGRTLAHYAIAFIFWFGRTLLWVGLLLLSVVKWIIGLFVSSLPEPSLDTDFHTPTKKVHGGRTIIVNQNVNIYE